MIRLKIVMSSMIAILLLSVAGLKAQTKNQSILSFNEGAELMKTNAGDPGKAIVAFEKCIVICDQVGDSAKDVKEKAMLVLPDLYYQKAKLLATDKKWAESIKASKEAVKVAEKYNSDKIKDAGQKLLVQSYIGLGSYYYTTKDNENAIKAFDTVLLLNPAYDKAYFNKALVYRNMENTPKFLELSGIVIEKAKANNDTIVANQMNKLTGDYLKKMGTKNLTAKKYSDALSNFSAALKYAPSDKDTYYYMANILNTQKKYEDAATNAKKGLELETGTPEAKAKFYFELASAQAGLKDDENACANYKKANFGQFVTAVKAQLQNLKCK